MRNLLVGLVALAILGGGFFYLSTKKQVTPKPAVQPLQEESTTSAQTQNGYVGKVLAGTTSPFLEFKREDYNKALSENKIIVLNFYANWCPICRAEAPAIHEGFNSLTTDRLVGFRVNFNDSDTDKDEEALAKDFKIPYQHSKVILKNGKEFSRSLDSWDKAIFDQEVKKALSN